MSKIDHPIAGLFAFLLIATFWFSILGVEFFGTKAQLVTVKMAIPFGLILLVPTLIAVGGTGCHLERRRRNGVVGAKTRRMRIAAANGVLILIPSAFFLSWKAQSSSFDGTIYTVEGIDLLPGRST